MDIVKVHANTWISITISIEIHFDYCVNDMLSDVNKYANTNTHTNTHAHTLCAEISHWKIGHCLFGADYNTYLYVHCSHGQPNCAQAANAPNMNRKMRLLCKDQSAYGLSLFELIHCMKCTRTEKHNHFKQWTVSGAKIQGFMAFICETDCEFRSFAAFRTTAYQV